LAFLALNGKLEFSFWIALGDDLNFPKWAFSQLPLNLRKIDTEDRIKLKEYAHRLKTAVDESMVFKLNAGKQVGSFNLAKCRGFTDKSDLIFAEIFGFSHVWDDIELLYAQIVKTDFENSTDDAE